MKKLLALLTALAMCISLIPATFAAGTTFTDIKESDWFYADVLTAVELGLVNGKTPTTYAPNDNLTYAEAIKLAACMNQLYADGSVTLKNGNPWYQSYVDYCKSKSIITKEYNYNEKATRAGYMEIFAKALPDEALPAINDVPSNSIPDVQMAAYYAEDVYKLYRAGILNGVDKEHRANPYANIKRSEVATILVRMMDPERRVEITDMGEKAPEVTEPEATEPEATEPEATEPEDKEPEATEPSTGGAKDKFEQVDKEELKNEDFKMTINKVVVVTGKGIVLTGYISAGKVNVGDTVYVNDADNVRIAQTTVKGIEMFSKSLDEAKKGDNAGILVDLDVDTYRSKIVAGNILSASGGSLGTRPSTGNRPTTVTRPTATKALEVTTQPKSSSGSAGLHTLTVEISGGTTPYTYQWQQIDSVGKTTNLVDEDGKIKGSNSATLSLSLTTMGKYDYICTVKDANGNEIKTNAVTLEVNSESAGGRVSVPSTGKGAYTN